MKKRYIVIFSLVLVALFVTQVLAEYDKDLVVKAMRSSGAAMGELKKAAQDKDFFTAAEKLMEIAKNMKSLEAMTPKKGSKEGWNTNHDTVIKVAFKGIGACGDEDAETLNMSIETIGELIKEGHGMFR